MKRYLMFSLLGVVLVVGITGPQADAWPILTTTLNYSVLEAIDLETGATIPKTPSDPSSHYQPPYDFYFQYAPLPPPNPIWLHRNAPAQTAFLDGIDFSDVTYDAIAGLTFTTGYIFQPFDFDDTVILLTAENNYFKIGHADHTVYPTVTFDYQRLTPDAVIPEPATIALLSLGLIGLVAYAKVMKISRHK